MCYLAYMSAVLVTLLGMWKSVACVYVTKVMRVYVYECVCVCVCAYVYVRMRVCMHVCTRTVCLRHK